MSHRDTEQGEHYSAEHEVRLRKVRELREKGIEPWPYYKPVSTTCQEAIESFDKTDEESSQVTVAGRIVSFREHGKTIFAHIQDRSGKLQIYLRKDVLGDELFDLVLRYFDLGDIVYCSGTVFKTKKGEITLKVCGITLLSKCLHPLPEKFHGLTDVEQRYRQRYLDLISNEESQEKFKQRSYIVRELRHFLQDRDFLEVETPMLHPIPGGAAARPFVTHHNAYDMDLYLRIAPELYLKRLVVGGLERVFEINRNFRNEGVSTKHNPEFTMLEFYMAHGDYHVGMDVTEQLLAHVVKTVLDTTSVFYGEHELDFSTPFVRMTIMESLQKVAGFAEEELAHDRIDELVAKYAIELSNKKASYGEKLFALFEECVEDKLIQPTFITGHPVEVSPLAKRDKDNPYTVTRFELFVAGMEIANGFSELNDPLDQAERFHQQLQVGAGGDEEAHRYDHDYIHAIEYGLPPTVGVGVGVDRLVMLVTGTTSIKDVILFPTMKSLSHDS